MMDREYSIMKYTTTEWVVAADDNGVSQIIAHCPNEGIALTIRGMYLRHDKLVESLEEIAKAQGKYDRDQLKHAENTIQNMKAIAEAALAGEKNDG